MTTCKFSQCIHAHLNPNNAPLSKWCSTPFLFQTHPNLLMQKGGNVVDDFAISILYAKVSWLDLRSSSNSHLDQQQLHLIHLHHQNHPMFLYLHTTATTTSASDNERTAALSTTTSWCTSALFFCFTTSSNTGRQPIKHHFLHPHGVPMLCQYCRPPSIWVQHQCHLLLLFCQWCTIHSSNSNPLINNNHRWMHQLWMANGWNHPPPISPAATTTHIH